MWSYQIMPKNLCFIICTVLISDVTEKKCKMHLDHESGVPLTWLGNSREGIPEEMSCK